MAIVISALSVVVPVRTLEALWPGGEAAYRKAAPNRTYRCDGHLAAVAFLTGPDAVAWMDGTLVPRGLRYERNLRAVDMVVVDQEEGPVLPCSWITFRKRDSWSEARLVGAPEVPLAGPPGWEPGAPGVTFTSPEDSAAHLEFVEVRGRGLTRLDHRTGKRTYMGTVSPDGLQEIVAGRLEVLEKRLEALRPVTDVDGPKHLTPEQRGVLDAVAAEAGRMLSASPSSTSRALFVTGLALRMKGDWEKAVTVWEAFTAREGDFHGGWMELTLCCLEAHRNEEALAWIDRALLARPDDPVTWNLKRMAG